MTLARRLAPALLLAAPALPLAGCVSDSYAASGAAAGGAYGAVGGALVGSFWGLVLFNDPAAGAIIGGIGGGLTGAYYGGSAGARKDRVERYRRELIEQEQLANAPPPAPEPKAAIASQFDLEELEERFGEKAVRGLEALIECRHMDALQLARESQESKDAAHRLSGLWLQALVYEDDARFDERDETYVRIAEQDPNVKNPAAAGAEAQRVLTEIARARTAMGRPVRCP